MDTFLGLFVIEKVFCMEALHDVGSGEEVCFTSPLLVSAPVLLSLLILWV